MATRFRCYRQKHFCGRCDDYIPKSTFYRHWESFLNRVSNDEKRMSPKLQLRILTCKRCAMTVNSQRKLALLLGGAIAHRLQPAVCFVYHWRIGLYHHYVQCCPQNGTSPTPPWAGHLSLAPLPSSSTAIRGCLFLLTRVSDSIAVDW